jgi:hypothetical protein
MAHVHKTRAVHLMPLRGDMSLRRARRSISDLM